MVVVHSHHGVCFSSTGLTVSKNGCIVALKTVLCASPANLFEHCLLGFVLADLVEGEFFGIISSPDHEGVGVLLDFDTDSGVL